MYAALTNEAGPELNTPRVLAVGNTVAELWVALQNYCDGEAGDSAYENLRLACRLAATGIAATEVLPYLTIDDEGTTAFIQWLGE